MKPIPMLDLRREYEYMKSDIDAAIKKCLEHQQWILGPEVKLLEEKIAQYLKVKHCLGTSSGTDALVLALRALAIKLKGKEYFNRSDLIITTPLTFTATGDAILRSGATPLFVDIDPQTFNIDPQQIKKNISKNVVGVVPVHLYGQACDMDAIMQIAKKRNLFVVEDVAQAFGGEWKNKKLGTLGDAGTFSFFPSKNLGGFGDGGMIATHDDKITEIVGMLIKHGGKDKYNVDHIGYNARLDTLQAAVLLIKLKYVDKLNVKRRAIAKIYSQRLHSLPGLLLPRTYSNAEHVFHQYTVRILDDKRDIIQKRLKEKGIDTMIYYPVLLHKMKLFKSRGQAPNELKQSENIVREVLSLPIEPLMDLKEIKSVCQSLENALLN